jgi:phosphonate transport system substrate-binding protein
VLRFALPPSLGTAEALARARGFGDHLADKVGSGISVVVAPNYATLQSMVIDGVVDVAWAPPFICARLELKGLRVAMRGSRAGATSYRAALVCRKKARLELTALGLRGTGAAWVDKDSVGGYLLAAALLKSKGIEPTTVFREQRFAGSYREALKSVLEERFDVTSVFAAPDGTPDQGISEALPGHVGDFAVVAYTAESPNDGVVLSGRINHRVGSAVIGALLEMHGTDAGQTLLQRTFRIDRFEPAPPGSYRSLYRLALSTTE